jgi:hypothetical protein
MTNHVTQLRHDLEVEVTQKVRRASAALHEAAAAAQRAVARRAEIGGEATSVAVPAPASLLAAAATVEALLS